jgi:hypothetical protein
METFWKDIEKKLIDKSCILVDNLGCRQWTGSMKMSGYGRIWVKWPGEETCKEERAHRVAYMAYHRILPQDLGHSMEVSHLCHSRSCVRAEHLVLESHFTNMERMFCRDHSECTRCHRPECIL